MTNARRWRKVLPAILVAVLWTVIAMPAWAALKGHLPHKLAESLRHDPDAIACLQQTCNSNVTVAECSQEHQERIDAALSGRVLPVLRGMPYGEHDPSVTSLEHHACGDVRPVETVIAERNLALKERVLRGLVALRDAVKMCVAHGGTLPDIDIPRVHDGSPSQDLDELTAERDSLYATLDQVTAATKVARSRCTIPQAQPTEIADNAPKPSEKRPQAPVPATLPAEIASAGDKTVSELDTPPATRGHLKTASRTAQATRRRTSVYEIRSQTPKELRVWIRHGATLADLQRSPATRGYDTSPEGVFHANTYQATIPFCDKNGSRTFDPVRWHFGTGGRKAGDAPNAAFAGSCTTDGGHFGIALQERQVLILQAKNATPASTTTKGAKPATTPKAVSSASKPPASVAMSMGPTEPPDAGAMPVSTVTPQPSQTGATWTRGRNMSPEWLFWTLIASLALNVLLLLWLFKVTRAIKTPQASTPQTKRKS